VKRPSFPGAFQGLVLTCLVCCLFPCTAEEKKNVRILFVIGGVGTGGGSECGGKLGEHVECKSEQRASIHNDRDHSGNHGWSGKATLLKANGFEVKEIEEGPWDQPSHIAFSDMDLGTFDVIVMGSNNVLNYPENDVDALETFVKKGGGVLFISDANFGPEWTAAMKSDQQFLHRFGLVVNQDFGTYTCEREKDFTDAGKTHPILKGVTRFDGEGVSPITVHKNIPPNVKLEILVRARTVKTPDGTRRKAGSRDAALVVGEVGHGRIAAYFDRNTFFNRNGAGTDIHRFDNATLMGGLYRWLAGDTDVQDQSESE